MVGHSGYWGMVLVWVLGEDEKQGIPGPVLHQPLSLPFFRKKRKKRENMNGIPVSRSRKTENAPTWRSPSPFFGGLFSVYFSHFCSNFPPTTENIFIFIMQPDLTPIYAIHTNIHSTLTPSHKPRKRSADKLYKIVLGNDDRIVVWWRDNQTV